LYYHQHTTIPISNAYFQVIKSQLKSIVLAFIVIQFTGTAYSQNVSENF